MCSLLNEAVSSRGINRLSVRKSDELTQSEFELLRMANLSDLAPTEAWTVIGTNKELQYSTHGAFRFFGKFPPPIATHLILAHSQEGDTVWDPMCGSGTTGVEALCLGRRAELRDVNPLSHLLARVKTRHINEQVLRDAVTRVERNYRPLSIGDFPFRPVGLRNPDHWFLAETSDSLRGLKAAIDEEKDDYVKEFLLLVFAGTVRRVSRATTQQGRLFLDVATAIPDALPQFLKRAEKAIVGVSDLPTGGEDRVRVGHHDLRKPLPADVHGRTSLVVLHPPYFNSYRYSGVNCLELAWLGLDQTQVRKQEVREFFKVGRPEKVHDYIQDMSIALNNAGALLRKGGAIGLMIGDTILRGEYMAVTRAVLDKMDPSLSVETVALRVPQFTEATWVASQRRTGGEVGIKLCDYVITLRKK